MNDLAEKALEGLAVIRTQLRNRPMLCFAVGGFVVSSVVVVAGGRVGAARSTRPLTTWLGLQDTHGVRPGNALPGAVLLIGLAALVLLWLALVQVIHRAARPESRVWWLAVAWSAPFAVGPPLMDTSVYSYAAYGLLQRDGRDPYLTAPARLHSPVLAAIDPGARGVSSATGPLGSLVQHLAVSIGAGSALGAVIVLRVVGVLAVVAIGRLAADMGGSRRSQALTLTVLNPLVLLYLVSGAHLDGLMIALGLAALAAADQRRWLSAVALACIAGSVMAQGFVLVPVIVVVHWLGRRSEPAWRLVGRDVLIAAAVTAGIGFAVPGGFGWLATIGDQFSSHTPFAVASAISGILAPVVRGASYDDLAAGGRITAVVAAACVLGYLLLTARHRALERTAGYALLGLALLAPILNPWYLLWGVLCLAPTANGTRRLWVLALSGAACLLTPPGFSEGVSDLITGVALVLVGAALVLALIRDRDRSAAEPVSAG